MRSAVKFGVGLLLTAAFAAAGADEARTTPFDLEHSVFEQISTPSTEDDRISSVDGRRLVRLRPITGVVAGRARLVEAGIFEATPGGRPIADTYDFAGIDFERVASIAPVELKMKRDPVTPRARSNTRPRSTGAWNVGLKALDYLMLTAKNIIENFSRILNGAR